MSDVCNKLESCFVQCRSEHVTTFISNLMNLLNRLACDAQAAVLHLHNNSGDAAYKVHEGNNYIFTSGLKMPSYFFCLDSALH